MLNPQIYMNDDYIVKIDEPADSMFFIHSGYIEILCKNGTTPLVYFSKGSYFGEIGVLITGKRSLSAVSKSNSVVYSVEKENLLRILSRYPEQENFLKCVA
jgi:CRP-like cAMP-binding protein